MQRIALQPATCGTSFTDERDRQSDLLIELPSLLAPLPDLQMQPGKTDAEPAPMTLVADIGGTFARFGLAQGKRLVSETITYRCDSVNDVAELCNWALRDLRQPVTGAAIAVAGPVSGGYTRMTNLGWEIDAAALAEALVLERVVLVNDFIALALALPALGEEDLLPVATGQARFQPAGDAPRVVFGPGTGLGVAALLQHDGRLVPVASEGGHISFAPTTAFEQKVLQQAKLYFDRVSWERILSGPGLELIYQVSRQELGLAPTADSAEQIIDAARNGSCAAATSSVTCFAGLLGSFGGDLALLFHASGGVVICGGIAARLADIISQPYLYDRFRRKGRFAAWLDNVPLSILRSGNAALIGAACAFAE